MVSPEGWIPMCSLPRILAHISNDNIRAPSQEMYVTSYATTLKSYDYTITETWSFFKAVFPNLQALSLDEQVILQFFRYSNNFRVYCRIIQLLLLIQSMNKFGNFSDFLVMATDMFCEKGCIIDYRLATSHWSSLDRLELQIGEPALARIIHNYLYFTFTLLCSGICSPCTCPSSALWKHTFARGKYGEPSATSK